MKDMNIKYFVVSLFILFLFRIQAQNMLTTQEAVALALEYNYGIKIAKNNVEISDNNANILNADFLPRVTGNGGATYNLDNTDAEFSNGNSTSLNGAESSRYNASVNLNYTLFDGLGRQYNYKRLK
jgi:outer membrane protein TolC